MAPFRLDLTVWALRRRARNIVDRWDGANYRRVMVVHEEPLEVLVTQSGTPERARLRVTLTVSVLPVPIDSNGVCHQVSTCFLCGHLMSES